MSDQDAVNHPAHYTVGGIETIDVIRSRLSPAEFQGYCRGNVIKYHLRALWKGGAEDMRKAGVYQMWLEESLETEGDFSGPADEGHPLGCARAADVDRERSHGGDGQYINRPRNRCEGHCDDCGHWDSALVHGLCLECRLADRNRNSHGTAPGTAPAAKPRE